MDSSSLHLKTCPVCTSRDIWPVFPVKDYTVSGEIFQVWHCDTCRNRFTQGVPGPDTIGSYYQSEEYVSHSNTSRGLINQLYQWVRRYTLGRKRNTIRDWSGISKGRLLDIGCGTGEFAATMQRAGWEVMGLEPDAGARAQAEERHGLKVAAPEVLFDLQGPYDVVTLWHVLEHVHDLHGYLRQIRQLLRPGGTLFIAVPNFTAPDAVHYQAAWAAYDVPRHLYHFSPSGMSRLLAQHGLDVQAQRHMPFDAFYVSLLSEKYQHGQPRLIPAFLTGLATWWQAISQVEKSSSVLYVIRHATGN